MKAELIEYMGSDLTVVNAARVSFNKHSEEFDDKDKGLINYLARNNHWTPFAHCVVTLRETVPLFVARQRFKHTVGFAYNEVSRRYVSDAPVFFTPNVWRSAPEGKVKQGSGKPLDADTNEDLDTRYAEFLEHAESLYSYMLDEGTCPEQARMVLPQSMFTEYYVTGSLYAFANAYKLRSDAHAQREIQLLAAQWDAILRPLYPYSWDALTDD